MSTKHDTDHCDQSKDQRLQLLRQLGAAMKQGTRVGLVLLDGQIVTGMVSAVRKCDATVFVDADGIVDNFRYVVDPALRACPRGAARVLSLFNRPGNRPGSRPRLSRLSGPVAIAADP